MGRLQKRVTSAKKKPRGSSKAGRKAAAESARKKGGHATASSPPHRIVLLGPPGAGKGTQAQMLASRLSVPRYATGDMLRAAVAAGTALGMKAKEYMIKGFLVPDDLVIAITAEALRSPEAARGFILDGFPRSIPQAEALEKLVRIDAVVNIDAPAEEIKARLGGRRSCPKCGAVFHVANKPSAKGDVCDQCGATLVVRNDDRIEVIEQRLRTYEEQTAPLVEFYRKRSLLREIDGAGDLKDVFVRLTSALSKAGKAGGG